MSVLLCAAMIATAFPATAHASPEEGTRGGEIREANYGVNVAAQAKAEASYTNSACGGTSYINDGTLAGNTGFVTWNSFSFSGTDVTYPVTTSLRWEKDYILTGMRIMWWADNANLTADGNVTFPKSCKVKYLDSDGREQTVTGMTDETGRSVDEVGVKYGDDAAQAINGGNQYWNYVKFSTPIRTNTLKLEIERNGTQKNGVGISEWEAFGYVAVNSGRNLAPRAMLSSDCGNDVPLANVNDGKLAEGADAAWNSCGGENSYPTNLTMEWSSDVNVEGFRVMWWADSAETEARDHVTFPKSCLLQYYDEQSSAWTDITDLSDEIGQDAESVGVKYGSETEASSGDASPYLNGGNRYWNGVLLKAPVTAKKLRLVVDRSGSEKNGIGIGELEVYGTGGEGVNVATDAMASSPSMNALVSRPASMVNDGKLASGPGTEWDTWSTDLYPVPVTLTWDKPYELTGMRVMWWADNGNLTANDHVTFPKSCKFEYYDYSGDGWTELTGMTDENGENTDSVGVKYGSAAQASDVAANFLNGNNRYWNLVTFNEPIWTTQVRLKIDRNGTEKNGVAIGEWEVFGTELTAEANRLITGVIEGEETVIKGSTHTYTANSLPVGLDGLTFGWSLADNEEGILEIEGSAADQTVQVKALKSGNAALCLKISRQEGDMTVERDVTFPIQVEEIDSIDDYVTATMAGRAPILPKTVVANGIEFDDPTPSVKGNHDYDFGETFNSKLVPVEWEDVDPKLYAEDQVGSTFEVKGKVSDVYEATAKVTVKKPAAVSGANSTVTFENIRLTDEFWKPKQKVNALNSLSASISHIEEPSGGEPNFINAVRKLNGEAYNKFSGMVFQDSDIYKSLEAISYTLSVIHDDQDPEIVAQRKKLEEKIAYWISLIEQVQYADGYIDTFFTLRSTSYGGGTSAGTHRWRDFVNHEMYCAGHLLEAVVAYTRYREQIGKPDYSLYVVGKRCADNIVNLFGPGGSRHEVPGHEEIELALVKFSKLAEEYEGADAGQKYVDTAKLLIDRRGEDPSLRESGYNFRREQGYAQDTTPIKEETEAVGHAVRACYFYAGVTDIATLLEEGDPEREAYLNAMDRIWDSVTNTKSYITGGIGSTGGSSAAEGFGEAFYLPNDKSYCEVCACIALANWNQRMNLVHEDAMYADVMERTLYNAVLVGTNLDGNLFYYDSRLEVNGGNPRSSWFGVACCPPNLMRTIAKLSEYMYTVHGNNVFVNLYIGSDGAINVGGTKVGIRQDTKYPWEGKVGITVSPEKNKTFTMKIRIPGWVSEQENKKVAIRVNGETVKGKAEKGYVSIRRTWKAGDVVTMDIPMEIRKTEANPYVTTNAGRIALERGPIVYCMEKAGNAQRNKEIENFSPLNFVIPRNAKLNAEYHADLLNGVVEITGDVKYKSGGKLIDAKLQAVPYYAWNNRGDDGVQGQNNSSQMLIWTTAGENIPEETDTTRLQAAIGAEVDAEDTYTPSSWKVYADALAEALDALAEAESLTQDEADRATEKLERAAEALEKKADKSQLQAAIDVAKAIPAADEAKYTEDSWKTFQAALQDAGKVFADEEATQAEVTAAVYGLATAQASLFRKADKTKLQAAVDAAKEIASGDGTNYTESSWKTFREALGDAEEVLADEKAVQVQVTAVLYSLMKAQGDLIKLTDKADLQAAVDAAKAIPDTDKGKYTEKSWKVFREALADAEEVLAEANPSQERVSIAAHDLRKAQNSLEKAPEQAEPSEPPRPVSEIFADVEAGDWFEEEVQYVYDWGIMTGLDGICFGPDNVLSRAQFAVILWRMEGEPSVSGTAKQFADVPETGECFFRGAVKWASGEGIITGYEGGARAGMFGPDDAVTREQLATMLYRYADYKKDDITASADLDLYPDGTDVSGFAEKGVKWAVGAGILKGNEKDQTLAPQDAAKRAQAATMLRRFLKYHEN